MQPLITTVLDLDHALGGNAGLLLGGGLGLYLKQEHLRAVNARTLLPFSRLPRARTTQDIDLFVRTEVISSAAAVTRYQAALKQLGFTDVPDARWLKFQRDVGGQQVELDLMVGPIDLPDVAVERKGFRVKPRGVKEFHARAADDAAGVEFQPMAIRLSGSLSGGSGHTADVLVPRAFPYALMKLGALRDRINDPDKDEGRHHALDLYRIVGMLTEEEAMIGERLAAAHADQPAVTLALRTIDELLAPRTGLGRLRLREHPQCPPDADLDWMVSELRRLLTHRG